MRVAKPLTIVEVSRPQQRPKAVVEQTGLLIAVNHVERVFVPRRHVGHLEVEPRHMAARTKVRVQQQRVLDRAGLNRFAQVSGFKARLESQRGSCPLWRIEGKIEGHDRQWPLLAEHATFDVFQ